MLALALGGCTVAELQQRMGSAEFAAWLAFYQVEPFGDLRDDMRMALVATLTANAHRNVKKKREPFELSDFMFEFWKRGEGRGARAPAPSRDMMTKFMMLTANLEHTVANGN